MQRQVTSVQRSGTVSCPVIESSLEVYMEQLGEVGDKPHISV